MMNFGEAIKYGFRNYANYRGVVDRATFWWWFLFYVLVVAGVQLVNLVVVGGDPYSVGAPASAITSLLGLAPLVVYMPTLALTVRRMRDVGLNPLLLLISLAPFIVLVAGAVIGGVIGYQTGLSAGDENGSNELGGSLYGGAGVLLGMLPGILLAIGWAIFIIVMLSRPTKTRAQGNRYAEV